MACILCHEGQLDGSDAESDDSDDDHGRNVLISYQDRDGSERHVHEECFLFHRMIIDAIGGYGDDPRSFVRENPEYRIDAIADAMQRTCRHCQKLGASCEVVPARGGASYFVHLPCARRHGHDVVEIGDAATKWFVCPLGSDEEGETPGGADAREPAGGGGGGADGASQRSGDVVFDAAENEDAMRDCAQDKAAAGEGSPARRRQEGAEHSPGPERELKRRRLACSEESASPDSREQRALLAASPAPGGDRLIGLACGEEKEVASLGRVQAQKGTMGGGEEESPQAEEGERMGQAWQRVDTEMEEEDAVEQHPRPDSRQVHGDDGGVGAGIEGAGGKGHDGGTSVTVSSCPLASDASLSTGGLGVGGADAASGRGSLSKNEVDMLDAFEGDMCVNICVCVCVCVCECVHVDCEYIMGVCMRMHVCHVHVHISCMHAHTCHGCSSI